MRRSLEIARRAPFDGDHRPQDLVVKFSVAVERAAQQAFLRGAQLAQGAVGARVADVDPELGALHRHGAEQASQHEAGGVLEYVRAVKLLGQRGGALDDREAVVERADAHQPHRGARVSRHDGPAGLAALRRLACIVAMSPSNPACVPAAVGRDHGRRVGRKRRQQRERVAGHRLTQDERARSTAWAALAPMIAGATAGAQRRRPGAPAAGLLVKNLAMRTCAGHDGPQTSLVWSPVGAGRTLPRRGRERL